MKKLLMTFAMSSALVLAACGANADEGYETMKDTVVRGMQQFTVETSADTKDAITNIADELQTKALKANTKPDSMWINVEDGHGKLVATIRVAYTKTGLQQTGLTEMNTYDLVLK